MPPQRVSEYSSKSVWWERSCASLLHNGPSGKPGAVQYFKRVGRERVVLPARGDKGTQSADIKTALRLARNL